MSAKGEMRCAVVPPVDERDTNAPVRLLKVLTLFGVGGTEGQVVNLVRNMDREHFDVQFACLKRWGALLEDLEQMNVPVHEFRITSLHQPHTLRRMLQLAAFMKEQRTQIVHSYNFYANVFAIPAARLAGVPVVIASIRDQGVYLSGFQKYVQRHVCNMADRILVNANTIFDWLVEQGYRRELIDLVPNGIDMSKYSETRTASQLRKQLNIAPDVPLVVMLSRLEEGKGVDDFVAAARLVANHNSNVRFLVVGERFHSRNGSFERDDEYMKRLNAMAQEMGLGGRLIFTGHRSDVPDILQDTAVSVLPSLSEGTSNSLLESMAAGVPIVATRVGGSPDLLAGGECGLLVPPKAPASLAAAIEKVLDDGALAMRLGSLARRRASEFFSMDRMVRQTQSIYVEELERHAGTQG